MTEPAKSAALLPIGYKTRLDERLKIVLDGMPVGVSWARLSDGGIEFMNRRLVQMLGYTVDDVPTIFDFFDLVFADPVQAEAARKGAQPVLGTFRALEGTTREVDLRCKDGTIRTMAFGGTVLPDAGWMVATFLDLSDRKERERLMARLAEEDSLTGLLNRRSFDHALEDAIASALPGESVQVVMLDLDGFKHVNDTAGHETGDRVLKAVSTKLAEAFRQSDHLARVGGDEFAAVFTSGNGSERTAAVIARIETAFALPFEVDGQTFDMGVSIGIARYPEDAGSGLDLYKAADRAMYVSKAERHRARSD